MKRLKILFIAALLLCISLNTVFAEPSILNNESLLLSYVNQCERRLFTKDGDILLALRGAFEKGDGIDRLVLFDKNGNLLWETKIPNIFSFCEREDGTFAVTCAQKTPEQRELMLLSPDGAIYENKPLSDEMLNPIAVKDGIVYTQIDKDTNARLLCKTTWDNITSKALLKGFSTAACIVTETGNNYTYGYLIVSFPEGCFMNGILAALDADYNINWTIGEKERVLPVWHELKNGDTIVCVMQEENDHSFIKRLDAAGGVVWSREIAGNGAYFTVKNIYENADGSICAAGYMKDLSGLDSSAAFMVTFDKDGNFIDGRVLGDYSIIFLEKSVLLKRDPDDITKFTEIVPLPLVLQESREKIYLR